MGSILRIAFCHNLKVSDSLEEAEYDTPETVDRLSAAIASGGHEVHPIDVSAPLARVAALLDDLRPDLIFNTAEGRRGRLRAAFFPALFEHLGIPFTGSDSLASALTLDKLATKERVARHGVPTPAACLVEPARWKEEWEAVRRLRFPVIVKPNYEGSSKGITSESVHHDPRRLEEALPAILSEWPAGLIVEEFIAGRDVTVGYLEALDPPVLEPTGYAYRQGASNPHNIYDYRLKNVASDEVEVVLDPDLGPDLTAEIRGRAATAARVLEIHDVGRFDFRISRDGSAHFLEANATPSLEDGAGLLLQSGRRGLSFEETILAIVASAARRHGIAGRRRPAGKTGREAGRWRPERIGLTFNLKRLDAAEDDAEAEFDSPKTIAGLRAALEELGHDVVELEALPDLPERLAAARVDLVFNIAEGSGGRNRESLVPALCELRGIPHTGSDAATLAMSLDKAVAKRLLRDAGVATPGFVLMRMGDEELPRDLRFPLIAKPNTEGTSKGLDAESVVEDEQALRALVRRLVERYRQPAIVEEYVAGREVTVGLLGWPEPRMLAPMEVVLLEAGVKHRVYHYRLKLDFSEHARFECPARLAAGELSRIEAAARAAFEALGCLDVARIDFRLGADGVPQVIEVNPLPGLSQGFSDLCLIAEGSGLGYRDLIAGILEGAVDRARRSRKG
jgi:D-alanine-D-alanine ligase